MYRIATGGILHETHTFAPSLTDLGAFEQIGVEQGPGLFKHIGSQSALGGILDGLSQNDFEIVPLLYASAMPAGTVRADTFRSLITRFLNLLEAALPVDGVVLSLHGAMVSEDQLDCEGEILEKVRSLVGEHCPLISTLDMHGNVSPKMVEACDVLVAFNCNPHTDAFDRGREAVDILNRLLHKEVGPISAIAHPPLLLSALNTWTERPPLSLVHQAAQKFKSDEKVLNISVMGGFAYADTPWSGVSVIVTTDNEARLAQDIAQELADVAWNQREAALYMGFSPSEAVRKAMSSSLTPVILADVGDNVGGGTPGDGTILLIHLLKADAQEAVLVIADAEAAAQAHAVGEGREIALTIGGKQDHWHGEPVQLQGIIEKISDGRFTISGRDHFANLYGNHVNMGASAVVRCGGVRILITSHKTPPGDLNQLRSQGIEPLQQKIIVVKSAVAFRGAYEAVAGEIWEVNTHGLCASDLSLFAYKNVPRPIYPLDITSFEQISLRNLDH